jgi:Tol biopolymer transport system component
MKKTLLYILFIATLGLNSCTALQSSSFGSKAEQSDYLVYQIEGLDKPQQVILYDPATDTHTPILPDWELDAFSLSSTERLAFSSSPSGKNGIYILDYPFEENVSIEIFSDETSKNFPLSWSPDGRYLLFSSTEDESNKLMLWDGKKVLKIYDYHAAVYEYTWNSNNQLAFTDYYTFSFPYDGDPSEIFIWDGNKTVSVSQNPTGADRYPAWSKNGQLAFLSEQNGKSDVFVWDGKSKVKGIPDSNTFINVAPNFEHSYYGLVWTSSSTLSFSALGDGDTYTQIYEWDGQTIRNISNDPSSDNGGQSWREDGYWSFMAPFSGSQNIHIRNAENHTVLTTDGYSMPVWSPNGLLMFCNNDSSGWSLNIWNGDRVIEVARGGFIAALWQNGGSATCSFA